MLSPACGLYQDCNILQANGQLLAAWAINCRALLEKGSKNKAHPAVQAQAGTLCALNPNSIHPVQI